MSFNTLPSWLPDWNGAREIAASLEADSLRSTVSKLIALVLADDTILLDSLDPGLESALIGPLDTLAEVFEGDGSHLEVVVASRLVRRSVIPYMDDAPGELRSLIMELPD